MNEHSGLPLAGSDTSAFLEMLFAASADIDAAQSSIGHAGMLYLAGLEHLAAQDESTDADAAVLRTIRELLVVIDAALSRCVLAMREVGGA